MTPVTYELDRPGRPLCGMVDVRETVMEWIAVRVSYYASPRLRMRLRHSMPICNRENRKEERAFRSEMAA